MIDVAPTVLEVAKLPQPAMVNGVTQEPLHGVSMVYSFDDGKAADRHETHDFEMFCNRGIYHQGWTAVTRHGNVPWNMIGKQPSLDEDLWEAGTTRLKTGASRAILAKKEPKKLIDLQRLFELEAGKYNVFPLDDCKAERANPELAGLAVRRPRLDADFFPGMRNVVQENTVINTKNKSHSVTAELRRPTQARVASSSRKAAATAAGACTRTRASSITTTTSSAPRAPR